MADRNLSLLIKFAMLDKMTAGVRAISGGTRRLTADIAATKAEISKLAVTQGQIGKLKALEQRFAADTAAMAKERAEVDRLKKAVAETDGPTTNMEKALANAEKAAERLRQRLSSTSDRVSIWRMLRTAKTAWRRPATRRPRGSASSSASLNARPPPSSSSSRRRRWVPS